MRVERKIYMKLLEVPRGKVTTYGQLAEAAGIKNGQRVVGKIMNKNPYPGVIPCHRVVLANGKVGGYAYGQNVKINMLAREGVAVEDGRVSDVREKMHYFSSSLQ